MAGGKTPKDDPNLDPEDDLGDDALAADEELDEIDGEDIDGALDDDEDDFEDDLIDLDDEWDDQDDEERHDSPHKFFE